MENPNHGYEIVLSITKYKELRLNHPSDVEADHVEFDADKDIVRLWYRYPEMWSRAIDVIRGYSS